MLIKIKKLSEDAVIPRYSYSGDVGLDLFATSIKFSDGTKNRNSYIYELESKYRGSDYIEYGTGLSIEIPEGYAGLIFARSSVSKRDMILANSVGVIDPNYRGEIKLRFRSRYYSNIYEVGDKIGQLVIVPVPKVVFEIVDELSMTDRGNGGFGSSGNR